MHEIIYPSDDFFNIVSDIINKKENFTIKVTKKFKRRLLIKELKEFESEQNAGVFHPFRFLFLSEFYAVFGEISLSGSYVMSYKDTDSALYILFTFNE